jgi:tetratricopeptide (TPR) repeat protein
VGGGEIMRISGNQGIRISGIFFIILILFASCVRKEERIKNARKFIQVWNYDRALTEIISFREDKDPEIQYILGYCYLRKNEFEEAAQYFQKSLAITDVFKDSVISLYDILAQNAIKIHDPERALFLYQQITKLVPEYEQANNLFILGDLNFDQGNYPAAVDAYTQALAIDSTSFQAKAARPKMIRALAESDSLRLALELATIEYENLKTAANLLLLTEIKSTIGEKLFNAGMLDSAKIFFDDIISSNEPKSFLDDAYFYIGEIYFKKNMLDDALESYKKVLRLNPYEKGVVVMKAKERINEIEEKK